MTMTMTIDDDGESDDDEDKAKPSPAQPNPAQPAQPSPVWTATSNTPPVKIKNRTMIKKRMIQLLFFMAIYNNPLTTSWQFDNNDNNVNNDNNDNNFLAD